MKWLMGLLLIGIVYNISEKSIWSDKTSSVHSFSEMLEKYSAVQSVFDFVEKAREIKVGCDGFFVS